MLWPQSMMDFRSTVEGGTPTVDGSKIRRVFPPFGCINLANNLNNYQPQLVPDFFHQQDLNDAKWVLFTFIASKSNDMDDSLRVYFPSTKQLDPAIFRVFKQKTDKTISSNHMAPIPTYHVPKKTHENLPKIASCFPAPPASPIISEYPTVLSSAI